MERRRIPVVQYAVSSLTAGAQEGGIQSLSWFTRSMFRDDDGDVAEQFIDGEAGETTGECAGDEDEARAGKVSYREARVEVERVLDGNVLLKIGSMRSRWD